jgi:hypothetical protein
MLFDISSATHCFPSAQAQPVHLQSASILAKTFLKNDLIASVCVQP